jgi:hypothetical protein
MKDRIIETLTRIETKLDEVIAALHAYDGDEWPEPNDALKEAAEQYNKLVAPCRGHDAASWDEEEANKRMDIIGQNGNEGSHYVTNEEADEDANSTQSKHVGDKKGKRKFNGNKKNSTNSGR